MSSDYFENGCANCLSNDHLSPLQTKDFEKLQSLTQLPIDSNPKMICAECRTLMELLARQVEVIKVATNTIQHCLRESRDESDDNNNAPKDQKRKSI